MGGDQDQSGMVGTVRFSQPVSQREAALLTEVDVDQDDLGGDVPELPQSFAGGGRLSDNVEVGSAQDGFRRSDERGVVVDDEAAQAHAFSIPCRLESRIAASRNARFRLMGVRLLRAMPICRGTLSAKKRAAG